MTADQFRILALSFPEALEKSHMDHPDFRVNNKIFATLGPNEAWGMVKLTAEQQASYIEAEPNAFQPVTGAWGRRGATIVQLHEAQEPSVRRAMLSAWSNIAPKRLTGKLDASRRD